MSLQTRSQNDSNPMAVAPMTAAPVPSSPVVDAHPASAWRPLLEGQAAEQAWDAILAIAADLETWPEDQFLSPNLASGAAGLSLFFSYLAEATQDERWADAAYGYLERMLDEVGQVVFKPNLYAGFTGLAWTLEHLEGRLFEGHAVENDLEDRLSALLRHDVWRLEYDLISGLAGFGVYGLEILPRPSARKILAEILGQLERTVDPDVDGVTWHTSPDLLVDHQRAVFPNGYHNLGLAHGIPGVLALLAGLAAADVERARALNLLRPAMDWLLAQEGAPEGTCFAHAVAPGVPPTRSRLAWCYGDPGVAIALLHVARLTGERSGYDAAYRVAESSAGRSMTVAGIIDSGLCHGSVGLGHLFNRFQQSADRPQAAVRDAAERWFLLGLEQRRPGSGIGGYKAFQAKGAEASWRECRGLLEGAAGIGLGLLAAVSDLEPDWDRVLMMSMRSFDVPCHGGEA